MSGWLGTMCVGETTMQSAEGIQKLKELIKDIKYCMMTTLDEEGALRSRPLTTQQAGADGVLWFFVGLKTTMVEEVRKNTRLNLSYAEPQHNRYVSVSGKGQIVNDPVKAKELWSPILKAWFPKGLEDPDLALLRVEVDKAEFWDNPSSSVVQIAGFLKAIATGEKATGMGEHKEIH
jgi:general stress protein 26